MFLTLTKQSVEGERDQKEEEEKKRRRKKESVKAKAANKTGFPAVEPYAVRVLWRRVRVYECVCGLK